MISDLFKLSLAVLRVDRHVTLKFTPASIGLVAVNFASPNTFFRPGITGYPILLIPYSSRVKPWRSDYLGTSVHIFGVFASQRSFHNVKDTNGTGKFCSH